MNSNSFAIILSLAIYLAFTGYVLAVLLWPYPKFQPKTSLQMFEARVRRCSPGERYILFKEICGKRHFLVQQLAQARRIHKTNELSGELEYLGQQMLIVLRHMPRDY